MSSLSPSSIWLRLKSILPPRPTQPKSHKPNKSALRLIACIIGTALIWHFSIAHIVIALFAILPLLLKLVLINGHTQRPSRWLMTLLTVLSIGLIIVFYGGWNGQTAGISFVTLLVSLKFLESDSLRDYLVVCVILYFLAACAFLFDSSILSILGVSLFVLITTAAMQMLTYPGEIPLANPFKSSAKLLFTAIPLAILLFFFFPRIQGDFGFLPSQDKRTSTPGIEDSLVAGELAASAFDRSLAFRAEFEDRTPATHERYWRVKVLTGERNFQWEIAPDKLVKIDEQPILGQGDLLPQSTFNYTILHEQSSDRYLPYLDYLNGFSDGVLLENTVVKLAKNEDRLISYSGSASTSRQYETPNSVLLPSLDNPEYLDTVAQPSLRMQRQLRDWRQSSNNSLELAQVVLRHFNTQEFVYSLMPPVLNESQPLEDFFFNTKIGYCEHYASAFTTIMRWLDVPARVVVGYQGGEFNAAGAFLEVRYSDAHAWTEIWVNNQWLRIDPTASVSPERIELGMEAFLQLWDGTRFSNRTRSLALANYLNPSGVGAAFRFLQQSWANAGYQWNKWVVNYDVAAQRELLESLGLATGRTLTTLMLILAAGIALIVGVQILPLLLRQGPKPAIETTLLNQFRKQLRKAGIETNSGMTPRELLNALSEQTPNGRPEAAEVVQAYENLRFKKLNSEQRAQQLGKLKAALKRFGAKRKSITQ